MHKNHHEVDHTTSGPQAVQEIPAPTIFRYTRKEALADGVLVDVTKEAKEAGWKHPVAVTTLVHEECIRWTEADVRKAENSYQDEAGRLWDVVYMAAVTAKRTPPEADRFNYQLHVVPRPGYNTTLLQTLKCQIGGGDDGEPVVTIMRTDED